MVMVLESLLERQARFNIIPNKGVLDSQGSELG